MRKREIECASAKDELVRINEFIDKPLLLIGGLAVQQYELSRNSRDIDLICDFPKILDILRELYPSKEWVIIDKNHNEYRPNYHISHRHEQKAEIIFGPKVSERGGYKLINWDAMERDARPFQHNGKILKNILIPSPHALAYAKLVSFIDRMERSQQKAKQDLIDFCSLTNHVDFNLAEFWNIFKSYDKDSLLAEEFRNKSKEFNAIIQGSCLYDISKFFHGSEYITLEQLGELEGSLPDLVRVMIVADKIEKPEGTLGKAVESNFSKNVEYLFLISSSMAPSEKGKYYKLFEAYHQINNPEANLLDIKALPFEWDNYPIIFYQFKDNEKFAIVAFRGSDLKKGITKLYERIPAEYAHTIAKSLLADAPKDVTQTGTFERGHFEDGENINLDESIERKSVQ